MSIKLLSGSGVNVPKVHIEIGLVATFGEKSTTSVLSDLFQVKVRKEKPHQASLAVPHKGYWFFIDETDVSPKRNI